MFLVPCCLPFHLRVSVQKSWLTLKIAALAVAYVAAESWLKYATRALLVFLRRLIRDKGMTGPSVICVDDCSQQKYPREGHSPVPDIVYNTGFSRKTTVQRAAH